MQREGGGTQSRFPGGCGCLGLSKAQSSQGQRSGRGKREAAIGAAEKRGLRGRPGRVGAATRRAQEADTSCRLSLGRQNPSGTGEHPAASLGGRAGSRQGLTHRAAGPAARAGVESLMAFDLLDVGCDAQTETARPAVGASGVRKTC